DHGGALPWRTLLAETLARQRRPAEGLEVLAPALADEAAPPALLRLAGELELASGRADAALPWLRRALAAMPHDNRAVMAAMTAWQQPGDRDGARTTPGGPLAAAPPSAVPRPGRLAA